MMGFRDSHVTLVSEEPVSTSESTTDYETRKVEGRCTYPRCPKDASDECLLCPEHTEAYRQRKRDSQNTLRDERRSAGLCPRCGVTKTDEHMCEGCRVRNKRHRYARGGVEHNEEHNTRADVVEADGYARKRFYGRAKRGAPGLDEQDEIERRIIKACISRYLEAAEFLSSKEGKALPNDRRALKRMEALEQLSLATRAADDVLDRNRFAEKKQKAHQRQLAATAREIAKSGR